MLSRTTYIARNHHKTSARSTSLARIHWSNDDMPAIDRRTSHLKNHACLRYGNILVLLQRRWGHTEKDQEHDS